MTFRKIFAIMLLVNKKGLISVTETDKIISMKVPGSKCISEFIYDKEKSILRVIFCHGGHYDYGDISENLVRRWMQAESKGKFFNKEIRGRTKL